MHLRTLKAVILVKLINLAVGRRRLMQVKKDQFVRDMLSLEGNQKGLF